MLLSENAQVLVVDVRRADPRPARRRRRARVLAAGGSAEIRRARPRSTSSGADWRDRGDRRPGGPARREPPPRRRQPAPDPAPPHADPRRPRAATPRRLRAGRHAPAQARSPRRASDAAALDPRGGPTAPATTQDDPTRRRATPTGRRRVRRGRSTATTRTRRPGLGGAERLERELGRRAWHRGDPAAVDRDPTGREPPTHDPRSQNPFAPGRRLRHAAAAAAGPADAGAAGRRRRQELAEADRRPARAGGGLVTVTVNGAGELGRRQDRPGLGGRPGRPRDLEDLVVAALPRRASAQAARAGRRRSSARLPADGRPRRRAGPAAGALSVHVRRRRPGPDRRARPAAGRRSQERPAHRVPPARRPTRPTCAGSPTSLHRGQGAGAVLLASAATSPRTSSAGSAATRAATATVICVVEEPKDVVAIERTREFRGRYHVLGGAISPIDGIGPDDLRIRELMARLADGDGHRGDPRHRPEPRGRGDRHLPRPAAQADGAAR